MGKPIICAEGEGEKRWFYGGGVHTWKALAEQTNGAFFLFEDTLSRGKTTPLHRHPEQDELVYVIEGEILYSGGGVEQGVARGGTIVTPRGVAHAFAVVSESARLLFLQTPGSGQAFYRDASEPAREADGPVDFRRIREVAEQTGATEVLGPPPFAKP
ncbi:MAG: cupin domain-containing protein [Labilithrix sp.]|nr:cupin domain-containing protein [Labilithrix sp.]